jgi:hypothetical protein
MTGFHCRHVFVPLVGTTRQSRRFKIASALARLLPNADDASRNLPTVSGRSDGSELVDSVMHGGPVRATRSVPNMPAPMDRDWEHGLRINFADRDWVWDRMRNSSASIDTPPSSPEFSDGSTGDCPITIDDEEALD